MLSLRIRLCILMIDFLNVRQSTFYDTTPTYAFGAWRCSPSYRAQWSFTGCTRVGRNLVKVPMRDLYKPKPDREIRHAHAFALTPDNIVDLNFDEEHIVSKVNRLLKQLLDLADNLHKISTLVGITEPPSKFIVFSRAELQANGWRAYPQLSRLAQVAPLDMTQQAFLSRCKALHEVWQTIPNGVLKNLLEKAGCPRRALKDLGSLKLLQALLNIISKLNAEQDAANSFQSDSKREDWREKNDVLASLFLNNDLRIADAHETVADCLRTLQNRGFDVARVNQGYGKALDFVFDGVITAFQTLNSELTALLMR